MNTESDRFDLNEIVPSILYTYCVLRTQSDTVMNHTDRRASAFPSRNEYRHFVGKHKLSLRTSKDRVSTT